MNPQGGILLTNQLQVSRYIFQGAYLHVIVFVECERHKTQHGIFGEKLKAETFGLFGGASAEPESRLPAGIPITGFDIGHSGLKPTVYTGRKRFLSSKSVFRHITSVAQSIGRILPDAQTYRINLDRVFHERKQQSVCIDPILRRCRSPKRKTIERKIILLQIILQRVIMPCFNL